ncbi:MAG: PilZ domain-containing protein [Candidatus Omnitrophica bacterium]|nr:PilZ domain-containing protein [Candidatus Omnitrophota bacterium]
MQEKRQSVRIEKPLMIKYSPETGERNNWDIAYIKNLSETGVLFDTNKQFQAGENILIMFKIPIAPDSWMKTRGCVVESLPFMGKFFLTRLKFTSIDNAQKTLIKDYVNLVLSQNPGKQISSENDKRKAPRIYKNLVVSYGVQNHLGVVEKWDVTTVMNFSKTGMGFTSSYICKDTVDFMIKLPSHPYEPFHIRGKVIASDELKLSDSATLKGTFLTRVEFVYLKDEYKKLLFDYIDWLIKNDPDRPKKEDE